MATAASPTATRSARAGGTPRNVAQRQAALDRLGSRLEVKGGAIASMAIALLLHVGVGGTAIGVVMLSELWTWHSSLLAKLQVRILDDYQVDIVKDEEPPPPPPPEPEPPKEEPKPDTPPPVAEKAVEPPPQAAAQAAKVLAADPTPDEPLDMTNVMVQGTGDTYTGGTTSAAGTGKTAVRGPAAAVGGTTGGTGATPAPTGVDKSRAAGVSGSSDWDCPFPPEADALQEDLAFVQIKVAVGVDGKPTKVTVTKDPGHGFAREARTCAMQKRFLTALDAAGNPIAGETKEIRVKFER